MVSPSHAQYAIASSHVTPTTGCLGDEKSESVHHGGAGARPVATKGAYSALVTGVRPSRNGGSAGIEARSGTISEAYILQRPVIWKHETSDR